MTTSLLIQYLIIALMVAVAMVYLARRLIASRREGGGCGSGCGSCSAVCLTKPSTPKVEFLKHQSKKLSG